MAQQVKFYSVPNLPSNAADGSLYFVENGELYKGSQRFGAGKVFGSDVSEPSGMIAGDIWLASDGAKVYDGGSWQTIATDTSALESRVSAIELWESNVTGSTIVSGTALTADTGTFGSLTASDATFDVGTFNISGSLNVNGNAILAVDDVDNATFGGSTIPELISSAITNIGESTVSGSFVGGLFTMGVTTSGGIVTSVSFDTTLGILGGDISSSTGTGLVKEGQVVNYVESKISNIENVMHFIGSYNIKVKEDGSNVEYVTETGSDTPIVAKPGDIVIDTAKGLEAICTGSDTAGSTWELIGDQKSYATNAYSKSGSTVMTGVTTVPGALDALADRVDGIVGGTSSAASLGVTVEVSTDANAAPTVSVSVAAVSAITSSTATDDYLPTAKAVYDAIDAVSLVWLDASGAEV